MNGSSFGRVNNYKIIRMSISDLFHIMPAIVIVKIVFGVLSAIISIINVQLLAKIIDYAGQISDDNSVKDVFFIYIVLYVFCVIILLLGSVGLYYIDNILIVPKMEVFHHRLSNHLVYISYEATHDPQILNMFWRAKDAIYQDRIMSVFMTVFNIVPILIQMIGTMFVLYNYSAVLVIISFFSVFPSAIVSFWVGRKEYSFSVSQTQKNRFVSYLWNTMTSKETIRENRVYSFLPYLKNVFITNQREVLKARLKLLIKEDFGNTCAELFKNALYVAALIIAVGLVNKGLITIGMFAACIGVFATMQGIASDLFSYFSQIDSICKYANDYYSFLLLPSEKNGTIKLKPEFRTIELNNVSYSYHNDNQFAIKDVNLRIDKGSLTVIVGENGSGKTTLSKLIMGLFTPQKGNICINGTPLSEVMRSSFIPFFSIAIQEFERYAISLSDNVRISDIRNKTQNLDTFFSICGLNGVKNKLGGNDAMLGIEFGDADLSGGEWQRVALARAIYRKSDIIILDEPTSAIDPLLEYDLLNLFLRIAQARTCLVISHRIGLCKKADMVVVMDKGRIVEQGTHDSLMKNKGKYYSLWNAQAQWYQ